MNIGDLVRDKERGDLRCVIGTGSFGYTVLITASLPDRLWVGLPPAKRVRSVRHGDREAAFEHVSTPTEQLIARAGSNIPSATTRATLARLEALWLLAEDPHHLLDAEPIEPLAHQASLVEQVLSSSDLRRVLVADEVGLGKTIEAGLIIKRLRERRELSVLYLTESRLVSNVVEEMALLGLRPRAWSSFTQEARLTADDSDPFVIASMHLAVANDDRFATVARSGPWDLIIVDEAHHLSDYTADGTDPRRRMRLVRQLLEERLRDAGRLILMTATPHQGHLDRYKNLLRLLSPTSDEAEARGRVVYRLKEDIRDWDQNPLFPVRRVHPPTEVHVGPDYERWLVAVHSLFTSEQQTRAAGWRRAQALQWCASSPMAGVAYLVRYALRLGLDASQPVLREAILALRPFRGGPRDETIESLLPRVQIRRPADTELEEDEAGAMVEDLSHIDELLDCIELGALLIRRDAFARKLDCLLELLERSSKLVVFAQPVETVWAIRDRLERELGLGAVSIIVGGQSEVERNSEIERFWSQEGGSRVLVSSRSGGEGINLQVCNRLVHFDVPWNPMDMEQRVGRVHRYGSVDTIEVHTLILAGSREERVLRRARAKLAAISRTVGWDADRQEQFFGRTMSLIPQEDLTQLMAGEDLGPIGEEEEAQLQDLVQQGFNRWQEVDRESRRLAVRLNAVDRGPLRDDDLAHFLEETLGARDVPGWRTCRLVEGSEGHQITREDPLTVVELASGAQGFVGPRRGVRLLPPSPGAARPSRLGLNHPEVAVKLRTFCGFEPKRSPPHEVGAACVSINPDTWATLWAPMVQHERQALLLAFLVRDLVDGDQGDERATGLVGALVTADGECQDCESRRMADLIRSAIRGMPSRRDVSPSWSVGAAYERAIRERINREVGEQGVGAVFPIAAVLAAPTA